MAGKLTVVGLQTWGQRWIGKGAWAYRGRAMEGGFVDARTSGARGRYEDAHAHAHDHEDEDEDVDEDVM